MVNIYFFLVNDIDPENIVSRGNNSNLLLLIEKVSIRLVVKYVIKLVNYFESALHVVIDHYLLLI